MNKNEENIEEESAEKGAIEGEMREVTRGGENEYYTDADGNYHYFEYEYEDEDNGQSNELQRKAFSVQDIFEKLEGLKDTVDTLEKKLENFK